MTYDTNDNNINDHVSEQLNTFVQKTEIIQKNETELRIDILNSALNTANKIIAFNIEHENKKHHWRKVFMIFFCSLLAASFAVISTLLFMEKISDVQLTVLASSILAEIFAIVFFMVKYVHNDMYLKTFKTVTQKLLDYLIEDKGKKDNEE